MEHLKYEIDIFWSQEDGGYIANVPELKYCSAFGETYEEALREVQVAIDLHLEVLKEAGRPIPEPREHSDVYVQHGQINEAAEKFADAVKESYRAVADRTVAAQDLNVELTQQFFNGVISNLRDQAESNREITQRLADQQETPQTLTQEAVNAYMEFVNSVFSYYQDDVEQARRQRRSAVRRG